MQEPAQQTARVEQLWFPGAAAPAQGPWEHAEQKAQKAEEIRKVSVLEVQQCNYRQRHLAGLKTEVIELKFIKGLTQDSQRPQVSALNRE